MNTGAFGEGFPYTNFHELNMDWIVKIAKDFLDQYSTIQQIIEDGETSLGNLTSEGLQQLQDKADALETLLQEWYNEHSEDIASQLAGALEDLNEWYTTHQNYLDATLEQNISTFDTHAEEKAAATIATIPDDYTTLNNAVHATFFPGTNTITDTTTYNTMADIKGNTIFLIGQQDSDKFPDFPDSTLAGMLITFERNPFSNIRDLMTQIFATSAGKVYIRTKYGSNNPYTAWNQINNNTDSYVKGSLAFLTDTSTYSTLASLPNNRVFIFAYPANDYPTDLPSASERAGLILTLNYNQTTNGTSQIVILETGKMYFRIKWANSYRAWRELLNSDNLPYIIHSNTTMITNTSTYQTLDALPLNTVCAFGFPANDYPTDLPDTNNRGGLILTFSYSQYTNGSAQILILAGGATYIRLKWGNVYSTWQELTDTKNPYPSYKVNAYPNIVCCGDSVTEGFVTEGTLADPETIYEVLPNFSYPASLNRIYAGATITNKGHTGVSAYDYYNSIYPTIDFSDYDLAIVELGLNQNGHGGLNISDIDTANTNTWCLKKIIEGIRSQNSTIQIAIVRSQYYLGNAAEVFTSIANTYNAMFIDLHDKKYLDLADDKYHGYFDDDGTPTLDHAHFTKAGYAAKAYVIARYLGDYLP